MILLYGINVARAQDGHLAPGVKARCLCLRVLSGVGGQTLEREFYQVCGGPCLYTNAVVLINVQTHLES